jgi:PAS domain S-box-containing protein
MQDETNIPGANSPLARGDLSQNAVSSGFGTFELDLITRDWEWSSQVATLFGTHSKNLERSFKKWEQVVFPDDVPKIYAAIEAAEQSGSYSVEFRVRHPNGTLHWIAGKGQVMTEEEPSQRVLRGVYYDITDRKGVWKPDY